MRRKLFLLLAVAGLLVGTSSVASAHAETFTVTGQDVTETFLDVNPCTGDPAQLTITYNFVLHITVDPTGGSHMTGTFTGTFEAVPLDPTLPSFTGHFTQWFGENLGPNSAGFWVTFNVKGTGSDGSTLSLNAVFQAHFSNGVLHVEFENFNCH